MDRRKMYTTFCRKREGNKQLGRPKRKWKDIQILNRFEGLSRLCFPLNINITNTPTCIDASSHLQGALMLCLLKLFYQQHTFYIQ